LERRDFLKTCAVSATLVAGGVVFLNDARAANLSVTMYKKALLTDGNGKPLWFDTITPDVPFIFNYPFAATPNFLILLDVSVKSTEYSISDGSKYTAPGGAGKNKNLVAYSAICPHQWSYPTKDFTVVNYYGKKDQGCMLGTQLIKCCAHLSVFDAKICGKKVDGPAENNMAMIVLEADEAKKEIYAVGVAGKTQYTEFFDLNKQELRKEYGSSANAKAEVEKATAIRLEKYAKNLIKC